MMGDSIGTSISTGRAMEGFGTAYFFFFFLSILNDMGFFLSVYIYMGCCSRLCSAGT